MRSSLTRIGLLAGLAGLGACSPAAPERPRDLLLITVDTLRPDFLGPYGYPRELAPVIDALGEQGVTFLNHHATVPQTAPSHASLFTGRFAREHGLRENGMVLPAEVPTLPEVLDDAGYFTAAVIGFEVLDSRFGFERGFDLFDDAIEREERSPKANARAGNRQRTYQRTADEVIDLALAVLGGADPDEPVMLWVHLFDPHDPRRAPEQSGLPRQAGLELLRKKAEPGELYRAREIAQDMLAYEDEIAFTFKHVGRLVEAWDAARGSDSVVAFTADHGEGLGEHDLMGHGLYLYQEQLLVPFVLRASGQLTGGTQVAAATSAVDVANTLLELVGLDPGDAGLEGESLVALGRGTAGSSAVAIAAERPLYDEDDFTRSAARAQLLELKAGREGGSRGKQVAMLVDDRWKLIWSEDLDPELYDLQADPAEAVNVAAKEPEALDRCLAAMADWLDAATPSPAGSTVGDQEVRDMLEALGY